MEKLNNSNIKLMIDLFHLQLIKGNITNTLNDLKSHIGHVQVSVVRVNGPYIRLQWEKKRKPKTEKKRLISEQYLAFFSLSLPFLFSLLRCRFVLLFEKCQIWWWFCQFLWRFCLLWTGPFGRFLFFLLPFSLVVSLWCKSESVLCLFWYHLPVLALGRLAALFIWSDS